MKEAQYNIKIIYPDHENVDYHFDPANPLLTAKTLPIPEMRRDVKDPKLISYTKHYYIGSERISSVIGSKRGLGAYPGLSETTVPLNIVEDIVDTSGTAVQGAVAHFGKTINLPQPYRFSDGTYNGSDIQDPENYAAFWYHPDHLGSSSYITNLAGEITQHMEYLPFGETLVEEHLNSNNSPYKFNAKEMDAETGNYYMSARYYDPKWSFWLSVDPLAENFPEWSPYVYVHNNPINLVDPTGMSAEPPVEGIPQYLDDTGSYFWNEEKGQYWHSESSSYYQVTPDSKSVGDATYIFNGEQGIQGGFTLTPDRPDYDGFVSVTEGVKWAIDHPNALDNPTPENSLFIATSKLDFGNMFVSGFNNVGEFEPQNLLNAGNFAASAGNEKLRGTVYALGRVNMRLNNKGTRNVSIMNDSATDYDWNPGGGTIRNSLIQAERARTGLNNTHGFKAFYYGTGTLNTPKRTSTPQFPTGPKY